MLGVCAWPVVDPPQQVRRRPLWERAQNFRVSSDRTESLSFCVMDAQSSGSLGARFPFRRPPLKRVFSRMDLDRKGVFGSEAPAICGSHFVIYHPATLPPRRAGERCVLGTFARKGADLLGGQRSFY